MPLGLVQKNSGGTGSIERLDVRRVGDTYNLVAQCQFGIVESGRFVSNEKCRRPVPVLGVQIRGARRSGTNELDSDRPDFAG